MSKLHLSGNGSQDRELSPEEKATGKYCQLAEGDLWDKFRQGDEGAFVHIYKTHFEELCHFGIQFVQLPLVEDCIQDLFIDLRKKRERLPEINKSIRLFLFQALKRRIFNVLKKQKPEQWEALAQQKFGFSMCHESLLILHQHQKEQFEKLEKALSSLNEKQREVVYYFFYKGMGYEELKELMGYDHVKSARNMVYKVVKSLKKAFVFSGILFLLA